MQIKRESWHYKLNKFYSSYEHNIPTSLCPYFWKTLGFTFLAALKLSALSFLMWFIGTPVAIWLASYVGIKLSAIALVVPSVFVGAIMFASVVAVGLGAGIGIHYGIEWIKDYFEERRYRKRQERLESGEPEKEQSLMMSFIKAKKSKYCPSIEFIDSEETK